LPKASCMVSLAARCRCIRSHQLQKEYRKISAFVASLY
jgi:hypothetical protein